MGYVFLCAAIAAEVAATTALKYSAGFSRLWPALFTVLGYIVSFALLAETLKSVPVGTAYAIWSGIGTAAIALLGLILFGEELGPVKLTGMALIIVGVVVLNLGEAR
jgi:small multidrug resistance pump